MGSSSQKPLYSTGSFTGYHPASPFQIGSGYLSAESSRRQPLCANKEGWGPLAPHRYDFTPCFMDVWVASVAAFGILGGAIAVWWLTRRKHKFVIAKDWHFWTKQALIIAIAISVVIQLVVQILTYRDVWAGDFRVWSSFLTIVSLGVIFTIQWLEHSRLRNPNGVVLFYWLLLLTAYSVKLRSLISQQIYHKSLTYFIAYCVGFGLSWMEFGLEWLVSKKTSTYHALEDDDECPVEYATVFSILTFSWMTPMMKRGYKKFLTEDDLWNLAKRDTTKATGGAFQKAWEYELDHKKSPSLWMAIFRAFSGPYFRGSLFKIASDTLAFIQPQLLRLLISWVDSYRSENPQPVIRGAAIALGMFAVSVGQTTALHQYFQRAFETGMRIKTSLTSAIYSKSLKLSNEGRAAKSTGDIVNYMAVDTQRLQDLTQYGQQLWSAPYQITLCMISLYQLVGLSMLAGVGAMIFMIPINGIIARMMKRLQKEQMKNKDSRTRLIAEIINNMKSIKLYAWGSAFMQKLNYIRNDRELKTLRKIGAGQAVANFTWSTTPFLVSCSTFTVFVLTKDTPLTTEIVFPALTLFNLLTFPLAILPMVITSIIEASVAVGRMTAFLAAEELQPDAVILKGPVDEDGEESLSVRDGTFSWDRHAGRNALEDINFTAAKGELSCIVGRVGAGKSSFLQAMLGDLWKVKGQVVVHGSTAYVAQQSWVMNASVKENILFGHKYDPIFYDKTVKACALLEDFAQLPDGDETEVGERGISLSGGQKARLTLARAVYARADIYLLDDCLSAVDQHVGRHLIENVLGPNGLLSGKTRILATNSIPVLMEANFICLLRDGKVIERGTYDQLMAMKGEISTLMKTVGSQDNSGESEGVASDSSTMIDIESAIDDHEKEEEREEAQEHLTQLQPIQPSSDARKRKARTDSLRRASAASFKGPRGKLRDEENGNVKSKQNKEFSEQGKVKWDVYSEYAKTSNLLAVAIYALMLLGGQTAQVGSNFWLKEWAEINGKEGRNPNVGKYIGVFFAFGIGGALLVFIQTLILWIFCSIEASRKLHERMALAIFRSPMSFFETTPAGRILNRFSSDIYRVDEVLARTFNMLFVNSARAIFTLVVISASTPAFVALIIPLSGVYYWVQRYYLRTSRELKRLDSVSRSPIYAHFQESLGGITTIRAYRQQARFAMENEWKASLLRSVSALLGFGSISDSCNRWLAVRLEFLGSIIILSAAGFAIVSVSSGSKLSASMVGLAMSYALQITQSLNWIVRQTVEVETNIVSVERVLEYARLPSEAPEVIPRHRPAVSWPAAGSVQFNNYSTRYREGLPLVLNNIDLDIKPHEKIGVVGRTGAGKSSLTLALFRIIEAAEGNISIDSLNTSTIGLLDLRRRLAIIPQDAALFEGTVRDNLDPGHVHDDTELWSVLEHARLKDHVASMNGGLEAKIHEGGSNLSQGQRQLVSLARALLTPSNILVLDEATAAVDVETDALLQTTLRSPLFSNRTIITIAHRINTIMDSDRIVVLEQGKVMEFDTPKNLLEMKEKSLFWKLAKEAGLDGSR
ncbi:putative multidrug resistance protein [Venustampulla echinocandica]|uniref:Putative multidrug resistance protein n=1 Tax=Venustampulla echinocandica TaxID=2656787 RepID=A0A370TV06_9HELO|nr:putative multidrug resistance protein [Venustampulla echinocandica]RDL39375.1 putative multidrug resistance protein [Venustampulla echinocandica]